MGRFFIYLGYNGANYCGWQSQPNGMAVQELIEKSLNTLFRVPTPIVGAGRTDAGVHARMMIAHFNTDLNIDRIETVERLNRILPKDISIYKIVPVRDDAHARFDAISRRYSYFVTTSKDPFGYNFKYKVHNNLDLDKMNRCAKVLFEYNDFTSFSKLHTDVMTNNCSIKEVRWQLKGDDLEFSIKADRFLRNMVRAIVGTLLEAGRGKLDEMGMRRIIEAKDRRVAGVSVPAQALFLDEVEYPDDIFL